MTPADMTPRQKKRQADVVALTGHTMRVYKPKAVVLIVVDSESESYADVHTDGLGPLHVARVLREIAADIEASPATYEGPAGKRIREYV